MNKLKLALGVIIAFTLCLMVSCNKEKTTGQIKGTVTDASTYQAIQGVSITINPTGMSAVTNSDGSYEFADLEAGQYTLKAEKQGYESTTRNIEVKAGKVITCDLQLQLGNGGGNDDNTVVVSNGLFCYFDFENEELADWTGNFTGINNGTTASTDTPSGNGQSRQFNGESFIEIQDNFLPAGNSFSTNIWFKTGHTDCPFIGSDNYGGGNKASAIWIMESSKLRYAPYNSYNSWTTEGTISEYLDNQWHMLTLTYDGETPLFYVDGVLFETYSGSNGTRMSWGNITKSYIGSDETANHQWYFQGKLDNFRSYSRALTVSEIQTLYQAKQ